MKCDVTLYSVFPYFFISVYWIPTEQRSERCISGTVASSSSANWAAVSSLEGGKVRQEVVKEVTEEAMKEIHLLERQ